MFKDFLSCAQNYKFFLWSSCRPLEWNFDNSAKKIVKLPKKFRLESEKKLFQIISTGPIECNFKNLTLLFLGQALDLISLKVRQQFFGKNVSHRSICSPCATGCQSLKISKACQKIGKFRQSWNKYKEPILGKKNFFSEEVLDMQNRNLTGLQKKNRKMTKTFNSESK